MEKIYSRPKALQNRATGYCPGCLHGTTVKIIAELIDEFGIQDSTVAVLPIGCSALDCWSFETDMIISLHGRAPATATGIKRNAPEKTVIVIQGDGDLASIGLAEIMHAANRGENLTVIFMNNGIFGMTGGQMAPTTLIGQKATTAQGGRTEAHGYPMHMCEILNELKAPYYIQRCAMDSPAHVREAKKAIRKGLENQMNGKGFSFIELMSNCPTNWSMSAEKSIEYMREYTLKEFQIGVYRDGGEK
ncbi:MAG: thiamine pyrophosphate-dependent enzyme [Clostridia bacterium]|nr:thiamine pyrophosphate-dependent enzyme [Clostridia bacterium]